MSAYTVEQFRADLEAPYAWPGGYPRFFVTDDGAAFSFASARENREQIETAIADKDRGGWRVVGCDINWEDASLTCGHSGEPIESAYGEDSND